jgi:hypothetical protein
MKPEAPVTAITLLAIVGSYELTPGCRSETALQGFSDVLWLVLADFGLLSPSFTMAIPFVRSLLPSETDTASYYTSSGKMPSETVQQLAETPFSLWAAFAISINNRYG